MRFFYKVILLITAILCCKPSFAQQFEPKEFAGVKYQEFTKLSSDDKMPALLIYLHGKAVAEQITKGRCEYLPCGT